MRFQLSQSHPGGKEGTAEQDRLWGRLEQGLPAKGRLQEKNMGVIQVCFVGNKPHFVRVRPSCLAEIGDRLPAGLSALKWELQQSFVNQGSVR